MTIKVDKRSRWYDPNFQPNAGPTASDDFAPLGLTGSGALRDFIQRETHASLSDSRTSETLAPGIYLKRQANSDWELLVRHGPRGAFLAYYGTKEELLEIAEQKIGERNDRRNNER